MGETSVERLKGDVHRVRVDITNESLIPTITVRGRENNVVRPDLITVAGDVEIIAVGWVVDKNRPGPTQLIDQEELDRIMVRSGHPGRNTKTIEYLVRGSGEMTVTYSALKGRSLLVRRSGRPQRSDRLNRTTSTR